MEESSQCKTIARVLKIFRVRERVTMSLENKKLDNLIIEAIEIEREETRESGALGFMARVFIQATMPHRNPGNIEAWGRENGAFSMVMQPGIIKQDGELVRIGLPYGSIPRLLLAWVTAEAVKTKRPNLILGTSLSKFMFELGLVPTGGRWGSITRLREQMKRLFSASVSFHYSGDIAENSGSTQTLELARTSFNITKSYQLWWDPKSPNQAAFWNSEITLNRDFFDEITCCPIPIDMRVLKSIKQSPMALDIYCWLTYRMSYLKKATQIPWPLLQVQFGASYAHDLQGVRNFKKAFQRELKKVKLFYSEAKVENGKYGLILKPSLNHISEKLTGLPLTSKHKQSKKLELNKKILRINYMKYCHAQLVNIIENDLNIKEKKLFFTEFTEYIKRKETRNVSVSSFSLRGDRSKKWLYRFVDNFWHHLIKQLKTFEEFKTN